MLPSSSCEEQVNALNGVPARVSAVEAQLVDLRRDLTNLRDEFVSFRVEVRNEFGALRGEIRSGDEETRRQMRVLHEEVLSRIALIQEGLGSPRPGSGRSSPRRSSKRR
jgi:hypothetical protein